MNTKSTQLENYVFVKLPSPVLLDKKLSHGAKIVYAYLLYRAFGKGRCWPSQATIARELGVNPRTVRRFLVELEVGNLVSRESRGCEKSLMYHLLPISKAYPEEYLAEFPMFGAGPRKADKADKYILPE